MTTRGSLGRDYDAGAVIVQQGEDGDCMYVIQAGQVKVVREENGREVILDVLDSGDFFGEMALFDREPRAASVLAIGQTKVLTIDKKTFLRRIQEDPTLAFRLVEKMSGRIRELNKKLSKGNK